MQKGAARAAAAGMAFDTGEVGRLADNFRYVRFGSLADIKARIEMSALASKADISAVGINVR